MCKDEVILVMRRELIDFFKENVLLVDSMMHTNKDTVQLVVYKPTNIDPSEFLEVTIESEQKINITKYLKTDSIWDITFDQDYSYKDITGSFFERIGLFKY